MSNHTKYYKVIDSNEGMSEFFRNALTQESSPQKAKSGDISTEVPTVGEESK